MEILIQVLLTVNEFLQITLIFLQNLGSGFVKNMLNLNGYALIMVVVGVIYGLFGFIVFVKSVEKKRIERLEEEENEEDD